REDAEISRTYEDAVRHSAREWVLGGCASSTDEAESAGAEVNASGPITVQNYKTHPKIVAIRDAVEEIDINQFTETSKADCDSTRTKSVDEKGVIRTLVVSGGEGRFDAETTTYWDASGKAIFTLKVEHWQSDDRMETWHGTEHRVYFANDGLT